MKRVIASKKQVFFVTGIIIVACAIVCTILTISGKSPSKDPEKLTEYINKHETELVELATQNPNQKKSINNFLGIDSIDTRTDDVCFSFSWSFDIPEGGCFLYYARDGILENSGFSFTDSAYIDGLGIRGNGYIKCIKLKQNWFYIEYNIPT